MFKTGCWRMISTFLLQRHFHQQNGFFPESNVLLGKAPVSTVKEAIFIGLGKAPINAVNEARFLGLLFDMKVTFKDTLKLPVRKLFTFCKLWYILIGMHHPAHLYHSLIWAKLDYGYIVYGLAHHSVLKLLDPFHTSPAQIICMEAHEPSLASGHLKLSLNNVIKLKPLSEIQLTFAFF